MLSEKLSFDTKRVVKVKKIDPSPWDKMDKNEEKRVFINGTLVYRLGSKVEK
jgi:hypothetical protein